MKKLWKTIGLTIAATTSVLALVAYALLYFHVFFLLTAEDARNLVQSYNEQNQFLQQLWNALQMCKGS